MPPLPQRSIPDLTADDAARGCLGCLIVAVVVVAMMGVTAWVMGLKI